MSKVEGWSLRNNFAVDTSGAFELTKSFDTLEIIPDSLSRYVRYLRVVVSRNPSWIKPTHYLPCKWASYLTIWISGCCPFQTQVIQFWLNILNSLNFSDGSVKRIKALILSLEVRKISRSWICHPLVTSFNWWSQDRTRAGFSWMSVHALAQIIPCLRDNGIRLPTPLSRSLAVDIVQNTSLIFFARPRIVRVGFVVLNGNYFERINRCCMFFTSIFSGNISILEAVNDFDQNLRGRINHSFRYVVTSRSGVMKNMDASLRHLRE
jgi:hypothetical protein